MDTTGLISTLSVVSQSENEVNTMGYIEAAAKAIAEWTLFWHSDTGAHIDKLWADPVNFWRDILRPDLVKELE